MDFTRAVSVTHTHTRTHTQTHTQTRNIAVTLELQKTDWNFTYTPSTTAKGLDGFEVHTLRTHMLLNAPTLGLLTSLLNTQTYI